MSCKRNWFASVNLLGFLDLPLLDSIDESLPPKLQLEHIESEFTIAKEGIQKINELHLDQIKESIEAPLTSLIKINLFLQKWGKIKKKEIASLICNVELHLEHAQYQDIQDLLDAFSKW